MVQKWQKICNEREPVNALLDARDKRRGRIIAAAHRLQSIEREKKKVSFLLLIGWTGSGLVFSCLEGGGGGLGSFWKAAAGNERLRSFLRRRIVLTKFDLFQSLSFSYLESWRQPLCRVLAGCECTSKLALCDSRLIPESTERRFKSSAFELLAAEEEDEDEALL